MNSLSNELEKKINKPINGLHFVINSREVRPNSLFFALPGERVNGEDFLFQVAQNQGVCAIISQGYQGEDFGLILHRVKEVKSYLQSLAKEVRREKRARVIGITGSVGKTSIKEYLYHLLNQKYMTNKSPKSYNSQITLPLTVLNLPDSDYWVLEMGMSQFFELERLTCIAAPDIALITSIGHSHIEFFPEGRRGIAKAKKEIFASNPPLKIVHHDFLSFYPEYDGITFSDTNLKADYFFLQKERNLEIYHRGNKESYHLPFEERHLVFSLAIAIMVARVCGVEKKTIQESLFSLPTLDRRYEKKEKKGIEFILDCYNASFDSYLAIIENMPKENKRVIGVLGEMRGLGSYSDDFHRQILEKAKKKFDHILLYGKSWEKVIDQDKDESLLFSTKEDLLERLTYLARKGDKVLIKGARSLEMEEIFIRFV